MIILNSWGSMARIKRGKFKRQFTARNYRNALPKLLEDSGQRCAYSMRHVINAGGMEVDHFDPTLRGDKRHEYVNLLPSIRHCNGKKSNHWPSQELRDKGISLINPAEEVDYGEHIFEDPVSHLLVGHTSRGKYQILICDLNAPFLVEERAERAKLRLLWESGIYNYSRNFSAPQLEQVQNCLETFKAHVEKMIPYIPPPPLESNH
ncbi:hypothetical protein FEM03_19745 [Phragmitibacter flavus]|uniref:HNH endonuclease n=1 Tax=Phragmitibacter flavus TaxID=2576071 RepID=A0A5R8K9X3_9BACT|nr:hypothetical protein [Phragmitibacter flavus]TLD69101.1 hypothetical protein FEM03_19745 [Phragmitibacter flavus]